MSTLHRTPHHHPWRALDEGQTPSHVYGSKTPAPKKMSQKLDTAARKLTKTVGSKARAFSIYVDENSAARADSSAFEPQRLFKDAVCCPLSAAAPRTTQKGAKPLEDKTNTVKKLRQKNAAGRGHPASPSAGGAPYKPVSARKGSVSSRALNTHTTPHTKKAVRMNAPPPSASHGADPLKRLLYRTPVTAKRARRPPVALASSDCEDDEQAEASFAYSDQAVDCLPFALDGDDVPDVEYGPPSALVEPIEFPEQVHDFSELLGALKNPSDGRLPYQYTSDGVLNMDDYVTQILLEDGQKNQWGYERSVEMSDYSGEKEFDGLYLPSMRSRSKHSKPGIQSRPATVSKAPGKSMATRSTTTTLRLRQLASLSAPTVRDSGKSTLTSLSSRTRTLPRPTQSRATILRGSVFEQPLAKPAPALKGHSSVGQPAVKQPSRAMVEYQAIIKHVVELEMSKVERELDEYLSGGGGFGESCTGEIHQLDEFRFEI